MNDWCVSELLADMVFIMIFSHISCCLLVIKSMGDKLLHVLKQCIMFSQLEIAYPT